MAPIAVGVLATTSKPPGTFSIWSPWAHPNVDLTGKILKEYALLDLFQLRSSVFSPLGRLNSAAKMAGQQLHSVADSQQRSVKVIDSWIRMG